VELGALAGAAGGCLAAGVLYALGRARVTRLTASLQLLELQIDAAARALVAVERASDAARAASGEGQADGGEHH
jgi:hypothetical protein